MANLKKLKRQIGFAEVLEHYGLLDRLKQTKPGQYRGVCPIHEGAETKSSFSANTDINGFRCFSCGADGDIIDFVMAMENCEEAKAGRLLDQWFGAGSARRAGRLLVQEKTKGGGQKTPASKPLVSNDNRGGGAPIRAANTGENGEALKIEPEEINKPLTFTLKNLNAKHPYLLSRVKPETAEFFGLGFCSAGSMKSRVVIPIHNEAGELVAYTGRAVDVETEKEEGKYRLPKDFKKGRVLFNLHRVLEAVRQGEALILVEGFFDCFRLYELGYKNVVALMGCELTTKQEELLRSVLTGGSRVALMFDSDRAGLACRRDVAVRLVKWCFIKIVELPEGVRQPDQFKEGIDIF